MPNVRKYLKQTVTLKRRVRNESGEGVNDRFGAPLYEEPAEVRARKTPREGTVRSPTGEYIDARGEVVTGPETPVSVGDEIDGEEVRGVDTRVGKTGRVVGYWSYL